MLTQPTAIDPEGMQRSAAFAHGMVAPAGPTLYIGGQNGVDGSGRMLEGLAAQTQQALRNVLAVLEAAGSGPDFVVKLTIYLAPGVEVNEAYAAAAEVWGTRRTSVTVLSVAPAKPGALVEIDAIAAAPS
ncbi:RidA family protein [Ruicaihuangia caeni]|uniref:RidA family protein n=1 Tax=Ruicaihuangia caeni TaxID=3042517 RepID=A0AAW6T324_9MICO|nr:RidA family protein [Klugiella sp. YN-L-19]MDI2098211.1 RidA family protein [Klugiella sp. YN-L-19]